MQHWQQKINLNLILYNAALATKIKLNVMYPALATKIKLLLYRPMQHLQQSIEKLEGEHLKRS